MYIVCTSATCTYVEDYFRYYIFVTRLLIQSNYGGFEKIVRPNLIMKIFIIRIIIIITIQIIIIIKIALIIFI